MEFNLQNKKILITGASGGIGKAICKKFIENGSTLICTSSSAERMNLLKNEFGNNHYFYELDLSKIENLKIKIKEIIKEHQRIDILINNAGHTEDNLFIRMKDEQWQKVIDINLNSNFYLIKEIMPSMLKNKKGTIIGISSVVALTGNPGQANYTASKSGLISMYKSLALEVAQRNINVNLIAPGFIETDMTKKLNPNQVDTILSKIPMNRLGKPEDVASLALFLTSSSANYITGQTFHVNGGLLMV